MPKLSERTVKYKSLALHIGYNSYIMIDKIIGIHNHGNSVPIIRLLSEAERAGKVVDATRGKKVKTFIHTSDGKYTLCSIDSETLNSRLNKGA